MQGGVIPKYGLQDALDKLLEQFDRAKDNRLREYLKSTSNQAVAGTTTAFQPFNLDPAGKLLLPEITPLQNEGAYGVKTGQSGDSREYRAIVAKNVAKHSGAAVATTSVLSTTNTGRAPVVDYTYLTKKKSFAKLAPEAAISQELYDSSGPFDAFGKVTTASLITAKELEERHIIGDAGSSALGTTGTPTGTPANTGGTLTNAASPYTVACAALNYWGAFYYQDTASVVADLANTGGIVPTQAIATASAGITIASGTTGSIAMTVPTKKGAWGYVWYIKPSGGSYNLAGGAFFSAIPKVTITGPGTIAGSTLSTVDGSLLDVDSVTLVWDGLFAQIALDSDIPGEYNDMAGGTFTSTGAGSGVKEFETILQALKQKWFISPEYIIMSPNTFGALSNIMIGSTSPGYRITVAGEGAGRIEAGTIITAVKNQYMNTVVKVLSHPLVFDGKVIFYTKTIDYRDAAIGTNLELHCTRHFQQKIFAMVTDVAPPGPWAIQTFGAPTLYWPRSCGVIDNGAAF